MRRCDIREQQLEPLVVLILLSFGARKHVLDDDGTVVPYDYGRSHDSSCASSADPNDDSAWDAAVYVIDYHS